MRVKDARQTFLGIWIRLLLEGKPFEIWDGHQLRDFTYVDDAVDAFLLAAADDRVGGRIFNISGDGPVSLKQLGDLLVETVGSGVYIERSFPAERKRIDIGDYYADGSAIREALGWQPRTALREGLARTVEYYRKHLGWYV
jgi:UDP-glucose 4-epimerase